MIEIIPSLLVQNKETFKKQITNVQEYVSMVQVDISDGKFTPNNTWADPKIITQITNIPIELHLMVENPVQELKKWEDIPQVERILIHYESISENPSKIIEKLKPDGWQISIVLNPGTSVSVLEPIQNLIDGAMCMGVNPGFQGQKFIPETIKKLKTIKQTWPHLFLELDGAVNLETLPTIITTNLDAVCPGSAIFKKNTPKENVTKMKKLIEELTSK